MFLKWLIDKFFKKRSQNGSKHVLSSKQIKDLESVIGYKISELNYYIKAFSHRSLRDEQLETFIRIESF